MSARISRPSSGVATFAPIDSTIVRARSTEVDSDSRAVLMNVLDWEAGYFELSAGTPSGTMKPELEATVTHLLLEHARIRDEAMR